MTEHEWQTSSNPAEMWAAVEGAATERQKVHLVKAFRNTIPNVDDGCWSNNPSSWRVLVEYWLNRPCNNAADLLREVFENPWRRYTIKDGLLWTPCLEMHDRIRAIGNIDAWLRWDNGAIPRMAQAIYGGITECEYCGQRSGDVPKWKYCQKRHGDPQGKDEHHYVQTPFDPIAMPYLAEMLEEAGCCDVAILDHLRGRVVCHVCNGGKNRKRCRTMPGGNPECFEGYDLSRTVTHVRGCWVVDLLLRNLASVPDFPRTSARLLQSIPA